MSEQLTLSEVKKLEESADAMGKKTKSALESMTARFAKMKQVSDDEAREYDWKHSIVPRIAAVGLPARFHHRITDWKRENQQRAYNDVLSKCKGVGAIVVLVGERGVGKTEIAGQLIVNAAIRWFYTGKGCIPIYRKLTDIIARVKPIYSDFGSRDPQQTEYERDYICRVEKLIIDEIHDCEEQKVKDRILTDILDRRYSAKTDTVLISNQTKDDFMAHTNPSILSRINDGGQIIVCQWEPWR